MKNPDDNLFDSISYLAKSNPWLLWVTTIFCLLIFTAIVILSFKASTMKKEHAFAMENLSYFKSILRSKMFVLRFDIYKDRHRDIIYYYLNDDDPSGTGVTKLKVGDDQAEIYKGRIHPDDVAKFDNLLSLERMINLIDKDEIFNTELRVMDGFGEYQFYSVTLHPVSDSTNIKRAILFARNITIPKMQEEEKRKSLSMALDTAKKFSDSKTLFLSQMSHDIRTPLNAIVGMTNIALMNIDDKNKVKESLDIVLNSSNHLLSLINDILDMSKIETGKLNFANTAISLKESFEKAVNMHSEKMNKLGIKLFTDDSRIIHDKAYTDATRLEQVFSNIISNAVKYTKAGGLITISFEEKDSSREDHHYYTFSVKDTGIGMSEETLAKIFEPFERAKEVAFMEGSGLGMAITKNIVDALGGVIKVDSVLGEGTTVTVTFGFADSYKDSLAEYKDLCNENALIITPEYSTLMTIKNCFKEAGMIVDEFSDNVSFDRFYELGGNKKKYKIIAVSLLQPVEKELEFLKSLRNRFGDYPIIFDVTIDSGIDKLLSEQKFILDSYSSYPVFKNRIIQIVDDGLMRQKKLSKPEIKKTAEGKHALVVEDVEINAMFAEAIASMKGFLVDICENGQDAVERLQNSSDGFYSIVLMDIQMPVMNGYEATAAIRMSDRDYLKNIPIIAMSANAFEEDIIKSKECGMNDHISKPVDINRFSEIVDTYVKE